MDNKDLEGIKKNYGENFAKLCRTLFPTLLEEQGLLPKIIASSFAPSKSLFDAIKNSDSLSDFKSHVFGLAKKYGKKQEQSKSDAKLAVVNPFKLMKTAGYTLTKCETQSEVLKFQKYWKWDETLCTFKEFDRTNNNLVFFAVRDDANKLKREDFKNPLRQDKYGTSVISIQFTKEDNSTVSIKNRYNHSVVNPDATFGNDLENICAGLTASFVKKYNLNLSQQVPQFLLRGWIKADDDRLYKCNMTVDNVSYCENNIIVTDGEPKQFDKSQYELVDCYLIDKKYKTITLFDDERDGFVKRLKNIKKIDVIKSETAEERIILITPELGKQIKLVVDKSNRLVEYYDEDLTEMEKNFLCKNKTLRKLETPNVTTMDSCCICHANALTKINMPKLTEMGRGCFSYAEKLDELSLPQLKFMASDCFKFNESLATLDVPNLIHMGDGCFGNNKDMEKLNISEILYLGDYCFYDNIRLKELNCPNLTKIGNFCFRRNEILKDLTLPKLTSMGQYCFEFSKALERVDMPNLSSMGSYCFYKSKEIKDIFLPKLTVMGNHCFEFSGMQKKLRDSIIKNTEESSPANNTL